MANPKIKFKRSAVLNKRPDINDLDLGELAINTYDGRVFVKRDTSGAIGVDTGNKLVNPWTENNSQTGIAYTGEVNITGITTFNSDINVDTIKGLTNNTTTKIVLGNNQVDVHAGSALTSILQVGSATTNVIINGSLKVTQEIDCDSTLTVDSANVVGVITSQLINVHNFQATGVTTSFGGFFLKNPALESFDNTNFTFDDSGSPTFDSNPISAGIYADGSANFSGIVTSGSGFIGNLTGNVTGTASNATDSTKLNNQAASYYLDYGNFTNTPTLITNNNQLTNGAGYITTSFTNTNQLTNGAGFITTSFTNTNQLTNGAGFISDVVSDTTPQLGGSLDMNGFSITGAGFTVTNFGHVNAIGVVTASSFVGDITGNITGSLLNGNVDIADNDEILVGTGDDLKIYHDGSHSYIDEVGQGNLKLRTNTFKLSNVAEDKVSILAQPSSGVDLHYNNTERFRTTNDGAFVTGILTASSFVGDISGDVTGNADTATTLATARSIAGVSFDGSADISLNNNAITNGAGFITTSFVNTNQLVNGAGFITNSVTGDLVISGNVSVGGTLSYTDVTDIDSVGLITAQQGINVTGGAIRVGAAFTVGQAGIVTASSFVGPLTGNVTGNVIGNVTGNVTGNLTGDVTGDVTGNADTATTLATARNIAGVSFNGSADISLNNNAITNGAGYITTSFVNTNQLTNGAGFITNDITDNFKVTGISTFTTGVGTALFVFGDARVTGILSVDQFTLGNSRFHKDDAGEISVDDITTGDRIKFAGLGVGISSNSTAIGYGLTSINIIGTGVTVSTSGDVANISFPTTSLHRQSFTATAGQTTFSTRDYRPGYIEVYRNGARLEDVRDYTATSGNSLVLGTAAVVGDNVDVLFFDTLNVVTHLNSVVEENYTATANQTVFTTTQSFVSSNYIQVFKNGSKLRKTDFTATPGNTVTLDNACTVGDELDIVLFV